MAKMYIQNLTFDIILSQKLWCLFFVFFIICLSRPGTEGFCLIRTWHRALTLTLEWVTEASAGFSLREWSLIQEEERKCQEHNECLWLRQKPSLGLLQVKLVSQISQLGGSGHSQEESVWFQILHADLLWTLNSLSSTELAGVFRDPSQVPGLPSLGTTQAIRNSRGQPR